MPHKDVRQQLKQRRKNESRVCSKMSFGRTKPHICNCEGQNRKCDGIYDEIKKEQYVDSKGQHSFK